MKRLIFQWLARRGGNSVPRFIICVSSGEIFLTDFFLVPLIFILPQYMAWWRSEQEEKAVVKLTM